MLNARQGQRKRQGLSWGSLLVLFLACADARLSALRRLPEGSVLVEEEEESSAAAAANDNDNTASQSDRFVDVIVALWDECFLPDFLDKLDYYEAKLETVIYRTNSLALQVPVRNLRMLEMDTCTMLVEEDLPVQSFATNQEESIPWGVPLILPNPKDVPLPPDGAECFKICVVDSGLMVHHPDIPFDKDNSNIEGSEFNIPAGETWDRPAPHNSHGTHVAGAIIAERDNNLGVSGIIGNSQNICLLIARVFPDSADTNKGSAVEAAVEWCGDRGAKVINLSLGGMQPSDNGRKMYQTMRDEGRLVVAAAGNGSGDSLVYPASFPNVVSVGAVDRSLRRASFSQYNSQVDLCAPGVDVLSTTPGAVVEDQDEGQEYGMHLLQHSFVPLDVNDITAETVDCGLGLEDCTGAKGKICLIQRGSIAFKDKAVACENGGGVAAIIYNNGSSRFTGTLTANNGISIPVVGVTGSDGQELMSNAPSTVSINFQEGSYAWLSGTSMAAPYVTATASLIWAARPFCTPDQVQTALEQTALDLGMNGRDDEYGHGFVQAKDAYQYLLRMDPPCGLAENEPKSATTPPPTIPPKKDQELSKDDKDKLYEESTRGGLTRNRGRRGRKLKGKPPKAYPM